MVNVTVQNMNTLFGKFLVHRQDPFTPEQKMRLGSLGEDKEFQVPNRCGNVMRRASTQINSPSRAILQEETIVRSFAGLELRR